MTDMLPTPHTQGRARRLTLLCGLLALSPLAQADYFDFNLDGKSLRAFYAQKITFERPKVTPDLEIGYLFSQDPDNADPLFNIGLVTKGENFLKGSNAQIRMGGRAIFAKAKEEHVAALGFGGRAMYFPREMDLWSFAAELYYAPQITSFINARAYSEYGLRADYNILVDGSIYIGWTRINAKFEKSGSTVLLQDLHLGMAFRF